MKLKKPVTFEGREIAELSPDFDALTGDDLIAAEREVQAAGHVLTMAETSKAYLAAVAARACGEPFELVNRLGARDFSRLTVEAQNFLLAQD